MTKNASEVSKSIRFEIRSHELSDTSSMIITKVYDVDPELILLSSPFRLNRDTVLVDTMYQRIVNLHRFIDQSGDTAFVRFSTSSDTLKTSPDVGLLYIKNNVFYYLDTTFLYSRNIP